MSQSQESDLVRRLHDAKMQFVESWADMGVHWGVPRSMTAVHALLFIEGVPMNMDQMMERLGISRGNASMTLRTLEEWGIVKRTPEEATRRDLFSAEQDVWHLFAAVIRVRKAREIDPLQAVLSRCREATREQRPADPALSADYETFNRKLDDMLLYLTLLDSLTTQFSQLDQAATRDAVALLTRPSPE
jgi:DNA-binding transcriptional regulator GbsR (MarR family)